MASVMGTLTRAATRRSGEPLNILTCPSHERYESHLTKTGHNFFAFQAKGIKNWNRTYAPLPSNYTLLDPELGVNQLPSEVEFDLVLSQNKFGQFQALSQLARRFQLPLVSLEHTLPPHQWDRDYLSRVRGMRGHLNVFISGYSVGRWGWNPKDPTVRVIHHGLDTDTFSPGEGERQPLLLSVVNDWVNRDYFCGFNLWKKATEGLPVKVLGDTPGLSTPAASVADLVNTYRSARVFVNTSLVSPVPTALLEGMACGCACISTNNSMLPEVIEHGVNGLLVPEGTPDEAVPAVIRSYCEKLLSDPEWAAELGAAARKTILAKFGLKRFVDEWNGVFAQAANIDWARSAGEVGCDR